MHRVSRTISLNDPDHGFDEPEVVGITAVQPIDGVVRPDWH